MRDVIFAVCLPLAVYIFFMHDFSSCAMKDLNFIAEHPEKCPVNKKKEQNRQKPAKDSRNLVVRSENANLGKPASNGGDRGEGWLHCF